MGFPALDKVKTPSSRDARGELIGDCVALIKIRAPKCQRRAHHESAD